MTEENSDRYKNRANPGYAISQMGKAMLGNSLKSAKKASKWSKIVKDMLSGELTIGSRKPVEKLPAWITLEVLQGGFTTGNPAAGGPLLDFERSELRRIRGESRQDLNRYYSSAKGIDELQKRLKDGDYQIVIPEEGALLVLAWLLAQKKEALAEKLLKTLLPYFEYIRFYPRPLLIPVEQKAGVHINTVEETAIRLEAKKPQNQIEAMREAILVWTPMMDKTIALFIETMVEDLPYSKFPPRWEKRAQKLLDDYKEKRAQHKLCQKPERPKENFFKLRCYLARYLKDPSSISSTDIANTARIISAYQAKHGILESEKFKAKRREQAELVAKPSHAFLAVEIADWLRKNYVTSFGAPRLTQSLPGGLPPSIRRKALSCWQTSLDNLLEENLLSSSEQMATILPQLTAQALSKAMANPTLRSLYRSIYLSFRKRRSLLLLNLETQVRLEELPFIAAISALKSYRGKAKTDLQQLISELGFLTLSFFPYSIVPNKLTRELEYLSKEAGLELPWTTELAADIFQGAFSKSFIQSAKLAAKLLDNSLYQSYYDISYSSILSLDPKTPDGFLKLCTKRAINSEERPSVVQNGMIIEQAQILTTHNLAIFFQSLGLTVRLQDKLVPMANACFQEICRLQRHCHLYSWYHQLQATKNSAYAWRQLIFYLSFCAPEKAGDFLNTSYKILEHSDNKRFSSRLAPALRGLEAVLNGESFNADGYHPSSGGRRLLGWTREEHWLMPKR